MPSTAAFGYTFSDPIKSRSLQIVFYSLGAIGVTLDATLGVTTADQTLIPSKVSLLVSFASTPDPVFTTDIEERDGHFDKGFNKDRSHGHAGYDDRIGGQMFAFKADADRRIKMNEFMSLIGFELAPRVSKCLAQDAATTTKPPMIQFKSLELAASLDFKSKVYSLLLRGVVLLNPHPDTEAGKTNNPAILTVSIEHQLISGWIVQGRVSSLAAQRANSSMVGGEGGDFKIAHLGSFFHEGGVRNALMNFMSGVSVNSIGVTYEYGSDGLPSSFLMNGTLLLGDVPLDLEYKHQGKTWLFEPNLRSMDTTDEVSIREPLTDVVPDFDEIAEFVGNISVPLNQISLKLECKTASATDGAESANSHAFSTCPN
ncbi:hypothetical protein B7494_g6403 [Chlorociboria aeruginascens]|nr:hypothetical protein B7494_g6403 [Chlorociboria aeruginascens]